VSYIASLGKKKGGKESMGTGFTQGSTGAHASGGGSGNKGRKGKKK
jgi:signal recognition particle subunit SRP72